MIKPAVALRGICVLPNMDISFDIVRDTSIAAIKNVMTDDQQIFLVAQKDPEVEEPKQADLYEIGVVALVKQMVKLPNNCIRVVVEGKTRAKVKNLVSSSPYLEMEIEEIDLKDFEDKDEVVQEAKVRAIAQLVKEYAEENINFNEESLVHIIMEEDLCKLIGLVSQNIPMSCEQRQAFLELNSCDKQFSYLVDFLKSETKIFAIKKEIMIKTGDVLDKNHREYYLREQLGVIYEELGEGAGIRDIDLYIEKVAKLKAPKEIKEKITKEINRLKVSPSNSADAVIQKAYIECMLEMPWGKQSKDCKDIIQAKKILNEQHYGLSEVKERVLDYLAVKIYSSNNDAPILCLEGPPGTGKTSIAKSIAEALNRKYVRVCLGGVNDEAEIRGHRKTYVGAMQGRISTALKQAGVNNPVILLDEIDKTGSSYKGDVASALLEVLDSEQNKGFRDHYLEVPVDLSNVFFIATANDACDIPLPLYDRMEVIEIESYTENEKLHIAKDYLVKKQMEKSGLTSENFKISDGAILKIIREYTVEAGVRNLERQIGTVCHKAVREILEKKKTCVKISASTVDKYFTEKRILSRKVAQEAQVGVVNGLAWTLAGGDTMELEAAVMPFGNGLKLTGNLGDIMQESAMVAYTYVKSIADDYNIDGNLFKEHELHVHVPEGAIPKDGPSAGITMVTAIASCLSGLKVKPCLAMTGEVTIRGRVLPIGGLKEKILAAKAAGVKEVIVPKLNEENIKKLSAEVTEGIKIHYVSDASQVLELALIKEERL